MTLKDVLALINQYDKVAIHNEVGYVLFDGKAVDLDKPVKKKIVSAYHNHPVSQIRPYHDSLIILLDFPNKETQA